MDPGTFERVWGSQVDLEEVKSMLRGDKQKPEEGSSEFLSSGSSLLNLATSGRVEGAFAAGHYFLIVGDSTSGKTWLGMSVFAEASIDSRFDDYRLIYDSGEEGALMNVERFFGERAADRIEWFEPPSETVEEFYFNVDDALRDDRPFVYVQDSQDSLSSKAEQEGFDAAKKKTRAGKKPDGSFGDGKAKIHSSRLRKLMGPLKQKKSILIILNQTRASFDMFASSSYSGGYALKFYATLQLWCTVKGQIVKTVRGKKIQQGINAKIRVKKNRQTGRDRVVEIPIYHSHGIDDVGSCVNYLVDEGVWKGGEGKCIATGLGPEFGGRIEKVVKKIEEDELEEDLRELVQRTWDEVEEACAVKRKKRY